MKKLMLIALAAFAGCIAAPTDPVDRRVTLTPELDGDIMITDIRVAKTDSSDFKTVQMNVVNNCGKPYAVQWKVQWLDADGIEIDSVVSTWKARALQPYEICGLKATAPRPDAADLRIYVRKDR